MHVQPNPLFNTTPSPGAPAPPALADAYTPASAARPARLASAAAAAAGSSGYDEASLTDAAAAAPPAAAAATAAPGGPAAAHWSGRGGADAPAQAPAGCSATGVVVSPAADAQLAAALELGLDPSASPPPELGAPGLAGDGGPGAAPGADAPRAPRTPRSAVRRREGGARGGDAGAPTIGQPLRVATPARCGA